MHGSQAPRIGLVCVDRLPLTQLRATSLKAKCNLDVFCQSDPQESPDRGFFYSLGVLFQQDPKSTSSKTRLNFGYPRDPRIPRYKPYLKRLFASMKPYILPSMGAIKLAA